MKKFQLPTELAEKKIILCKDDAHFISPQGEGKFMGRLSAWMRVSTCNLKCAWANGDGTVTLCDTPFTSHVVSKHIETCQEAFDYLMNNPAPHVVITGGEPSSALNALALIDPIEEAGKRVTIETNGTRFFESKATLISMSPKLASSSSGLEILKDSNYKLQDTNGFLKTEDFEKRGRLYEKFLEAHNKARYNLEAMKAFMDFYGTERYQFKFVANTELDLEEILDNYISPLKIPNDNVFLMPQGISHEQLNSRAAWVMDKCREHGFHYSDRIHIRVYGNRNGV